MKRLADAVRPARRAATLGWGMLAAVTLLGAGLPAAQAVVPQGSDVGQRVLSVNPVDTGSIKQADAPALVTLPPVDPTRLDMVPVPMGGVLNNNAKNTQTPTLNSYVWAIRQAGNRIFVGGMFLDVQQNASSPTVRQSYLAAFDVNTGQFISSCRPQLDNAVYSLAVLPSGLLAVGGEFTTVNGAARTALVVLDPNTCEVAASFPTRVERPYSNLRAMVRTMEVSGGKLYLGGSFSRLVGPGNTATGVYKAARVDATTGAIDYTWKPQVTGSGVWGLAVDPKRNRVNLAGWFSNVAGAANTDHYAVVDTNTGALVPKLAVMPRNATQRDAYDVTMGSPDRVFFAGSEHVLQMLDANTGQMLAYAHSGFYSCAANPFTVCGFYAGGDYQVAEKIGNYVFAGCHCNVDHYKNQLAQYSSLTKTYTRHKSLMAYDSTTQALLTSFYPDIDGALEGTWAVSSDTLGCLYIGGDYNKGGARAGKTMWLSGIARLCPTGMTRPVPDTIAPTAVSLAEATDTGAGNVQVAWQAASDNLAVDHYHVVAGGVSVDLPKSPATLTKIPAGAVSVTITAVDAAGNVGPATTVQTTSGLTTPDAASPTAPTSVTAKAAANGMTLTWTASTDDTAVVSYLIYRDGTYAGWSPTPTWTDTTAPRGVSVVYQLRATDAGGHRSVKSAELSVPIP